MPVEAKHPKHNSEASDPVEGLFGLLMVGVVICYAVVAALAAFALLFGAYLFLTALWWTITGAM